MFCSFVVGYVSVYDAGLWCFAICLRLFVWACGFIVGFGSCAILGILVVVRGCLRGVLVDSSVLILLLSV